MNPSDRNLRAVTLPPHWAPARSIQRFAALFWPTSSRPLPNLANPKRRRRPPLKANPIVDKKRSEIGVALMRHPLSVRMRQLA